MLSTFAATALSSSFLQPDTVPWLAELATPNILAEVQKIADVDERIFTPDWQHLTTSDVEPSGCKQRHTEDGWWLLDAPCAGCPPDSHHARRSQHEPTDLWQARKWSTKRHVAEARCGLLTGVHKGGESLVSMCFRVSVLVFVCPGGLV